MPELRHSVCALDCPDCCSVLVQVEDGRATRLRGDPEHPITQGFLCAKVTRYLDRVYHPDRILYPQRRVGAKGEGRFERISWDAALDEIAARLRQTARESGPEAILPYSYGGTLGYIQGNGMDRRFFHRLGATRLDRTICASAGAAGLTATLGYRYGTEPEQFRHSKLIIAWGANILGTNPHLWPFVAEARRNGAKFYTIDPIRNRTGATADRHFAIAPGTDLALALGLAHVLFAEGLHDQEYLDRHTTGADTLRAKAAEFPPERVAALTGLTVEEVVTLAREYATTRPAVIRLNYGVQRSEHGGTAVRVISMLPAVTGSWREVGGGLQLSTSGAFQLDRHALERPDLQHLELGREARLINMTLLGRALTEVNDPPVRALVVYNSNPAAIAPAQDKVRQALERDELFTVVLEQMPTDTTRFADIVLPATTFLEHGDLYFAYGHYYLQWSRPALPAPGEAKPNSEIFRLLARRMGLTEPCLADSDEELARQALGSGHPFLDGITFERLDAERSIRLNVSPAGEPFLPFAQGGFGKPDGRADLRADDVRYTPPVESRRGDPALRARFPLELVSPKHDHGMNSTFAHRPALAGDALRLGMHPADAASRNIAEGDEVRVFNDRGCCRMVATLTRDVTPGVLRAAGLRWRRNGEGGINTLTSERLTDIGGGPTFYNCLVQVERCTQSATS